MGEPVPRVNVVPFLAGQQESDARSGHAGLSSVPHARPRRGPPQSSKDTPGGPTGSWFPSSLPGDILQQRAPPPSESLSPPGCLESVRSEKAQLQPGQYRLLARPTALLLMEERGFLTPGKSPRCRAASSDTRPCRVESLRFSCFRIYKVFPKASGPP